MKVFRRWQRIVILFLLSLSVFAPLVLVSNKLNSLNSEGWKDFVQDLSTIKHRREFLPLYAVRQEARVGVNVKEPNPDVYRDKMYSIVSLSEDRSLKSEDLGTGSNSTVYGSEKNGTHHSIGEEVKPVQTRNEPSPRKIKDHSDQRSGQRDHRVQAMRLNTVSHGQNTHILTRRSTDQKVKQIKDLMIRAKAYLSLATPLGNNTHLVKELKQRLKELNHAMGEARGGSNLSRSALQKVRNLKTTLLKASHVFPDPFKMVIKLRSMTDSAEEQAVLHRNQITFLTELAGRTTPKGLHCLSMRLTTEYFALPPEQRVSPNQQNVYSPDLLHYVVFSDNVLAAAVVVNSTVSNAMEPEKIAFHVVSDSLNFFAFLMWFQLNPPRNATIQVLNVDDFQWLSNMFASSLEKKNSVDPRFSSPLNHLRFYLPEIFPKLNKIVLLDHDVVVQRDIADLWSVDLKGKVNAAVETCQKSESSYRRMDMLINFSDPLVARKFDVNACTWAFGMNLFDLRQWRQRDLTSSYRRFLLKSIKTPLCTAGTLPLGWLTFYKHTIPLDRRWHLLGLGSDSSVTSEEIENAAVIHYDGVMKPWLDIGIKKYKGYWNKYINYDHPYLQQCNLHG